MDEPPGVRLRVALSALTMAEYFRDEMRQDVLLFVDNVFRFVQAGSEVSTLLGRMPSAVGYQPTLANEMGSCRSASPRPRVTRSPRCRPSTCPPTTSPTRRRTPRSPTSTPDGAVALDRRARHLPGRRPARLDLAHPRPAGRRRRALQRRPRGAEVLQRYKDLQDIIAILGIDELSEEDKVVVPGPPHPALPVPAVLRRRAVHRQPGKFVPIEETIASFKKLIEGEYDHIPEQAFFLCGGIEDVEANAKKLGS
jgi:F-type H+/Na+-transporting ATPase subunit beta